eukprot:scaffold1006_cov145-Amphora_coffeaeformis.AAC.2
MTLKPPWYMIFLKSITHYQTTPIYSLPMMSVINPTTDKCKEYCVLIGSFGLRVYRTTPIYSLPMRG